MAFVGTRNRRSLAAESRLSESATIRVEELADGLKRSGQTLQDAMTKMEKEHWSTATPTEAEKRAVRRSLLGEDLTKADAEALEGRSISQDIFYRKIHDISNSISSINDGIKEGDGRALAALAELSDRLGNQRDEGAILKTLNTHFSNSLDEVRHIAVDPFKLSRRGFERAIDRKAGRSESNLYTVMRFCDEVDRYMKKSGRAAGSGTKPMRYDVGQIASPARSVDQQRAFLLKIADNINLPGVHQEIVDLEKNMAVSQTIAQKLGEVGKNGLTVTAMAESFGKMVPEEVSRMGLSIINERVSVVQEAERNALLGQMSDHQRDFMTAIDNAKRMTMYGDGYTVDDMGNVINGSGYASNDEFRKKVLDPLNDERAKFLAMSQVYMSVMDAEGKRALVAMNNELDHAMDGLASLKPLGLADKLNVVAFTSHPNGIQGRVGQQIYAAAVAAALDEAQAGATATAEEVLNALGKSVQAALDPLSDNLREQVVLSLLEHQRNKSAVMELQRKEAETTSETLNEAPHIVTI